MTFKEMEKNLKMTVGILKVPEGHIVNISTRQKQVLL